eukprot:CAMPEP_0171626332 /NCGR_PEP_ID=MMETSP0990-20121206/19966_1 /TAXON_ID=483369 /ORGANISM="non described non described, Strain CCMP2098" /LENGTH=136 /DNA_ID=CAMNT_0012193681 /DNA_START=108 /DNA_END=515 /DNA_ORIENTATION=+
MAAKIAYITANDDTSASESDRDVPKTQKLNKPPQEPRAYRLWSHEVNEEGMTVGGAIEGLGEAYKSGKISRFEFENRTMLVEHFSKFKPTSDLPFIVEEPGFPGEYLFENEGSGLVGRLLRHCLYSATQATRAMCW